MWEAVKLKKRVLVVLLALISLSVASCGGGQSSNDSASSDSVSGTEDIKLHSPGDKVTDWEIALQYLKEGNQRYVKNTTISRSTNEADRTLTKDAQHPFAVIITCSDSRVTPEFIFDQKIGDLFTIENAGNITDESVLGSIEYAVEHLETPLVVVVGHSSCGAVTGTIEGGEYPSNLQAIIDKIHSNIGDIEDIEDIEDAVYANVKQGVAQIKEDSIVDEMGATVIGAYYDIESGEVTWVE